MKELNEHCSVDKRCTETRVQQAVKAVRPLTDPALKKNLGRKCKYFTATENYSENFRRHRTAVYDFRLRRHRHPRVVRIDVHCIGVKLQTQYG